MRYNQGDIFLVEFPFTMATSSKLRPAIIVSNSVVNNKGEDVILAQITSRPRIDNLSYKLLNKNLSSSLNHESQVRCHKIFAFQKNKLGRKISSLSKSEVINLKNKISELL